MDQETSPAKIGRYEVIGTLGRGSMGVVYKARDPEIGREVAIKTLRRIQSAHFHDADVALERFRIEARSAGNLRHSNIITIFEANRDGDMPYLVMDCVAGEGLDSIVARKGKIGPEQFLFYLSQIAAGLDYAHSKGVIHRDIKPANILVDQAGNVFILDFGVALITRSYSGEEGASGVASQVVGSPAYMSPEQILNKPLSFRSDLFSLAVVSFECLSGKRPFPGDTFTSVAGNILNAKPLAITSIVQEFPLALEVEFERALARNPEERFESAEAMVVAFCRALNLERHALRNQEAPREGRRRRKSSGWRGFKKQNIPGAEAAQNKSFQLPVTKAAVPEWLADDTLKRVTEQLRERPKSERTPGELFKSWGEASERELLRKGLIRPRASLAQRLALILSIAMMLSGFAMIGFYWADFKQAFVGQVSVPALSIGAMARGDAIAPPRIAKAPEGKSMQEYSDAELAGAILDAHTPDIVALKGLSEAQRRGMSDLVSLYAYAMQKQSYAVKTEAVKLSSALQDPRIVPYLLNALDDDEAVVRGHAAKALGGMGDKRAVAALNKRLAVETVAEVKAAITKALGRLNASP